MKAVQDQQNQTETYWAVEWSTRPITMDSHTPRVSKAGFFESVAAGTFPAYDSKHTGPLYTSLRGIVATIQPPLISRQVEPRGSILFQCSDALRIQQALGIGRAIANLLVSKVQ